MCWWQDDYVQFEDIAYAGGANELSLQKARENFRTIRVSDPSLKDHAREPLAEELPENNIRLGEHPV